MSLKIVFLGTSSFAATILETLVNKDVEIVAVVTRPDRPVGRSKNPEPSPVKLVALAHHLPVHQPLKASSPDFAEILRSFQADLFVVAAYGEILKDNILALPRLDAINVHGSLLPKYRGAAPIQRSIIAGEKVSGVTIMSMVRELDAGDILAMQKVPLDDSVTAGEYAEQLAIIGGELLWNVIQNFERGDVERTPQNHAQATFAPKLSLEDGRLDWNRPAKELHNLVRGVTPKPGAWCNVKVRDEKKRLLIKKTQVEPIAHKQPAATLLPDPGLLIACGEDALRLLEVQLEGKKLMSAAEFLRGLPKNNLTII